MPTSLRAAHPDSPSLRAVSDLVRCRSFVRRVVRRIAGEAEADDIVQDVYLAAWRALPQFRGDADLRTWLYRIATHRTIHAVTAQTRRRVRERLAAADFDPPSGCPHDAVVASQTSTMIRRALRSMPAELRDTLTARIVEGRTLTSIARETSVSIGTAHRRERLALERIRVALGRGGESFRP